MRVENSREMMRRCRVEGKNTSSERKERKKETKEE